MKKKNNHLGLLIILFLLVAGGTIGFLIYNAIPKGKLIYDSSLAEAEISKLNQLFGYNGKDFPIHEDMTISAKEADSFEEGSIIYDIKVPVTDFYSSESAYLEGSNEMSFISLNELDNTKKILSYNGSYYLDSFNSGAKFYTYKVESKNEKEKSDAESKIKGSVPTFPTSQDDVLTINQTGVTALTRAMGKKLNEVGNAEFFAENIKDLLVSSDLTHISNEVSFTDDCSVESGSTVLCADNRMFDTIKAIGTDIVELTGNHNVDVGKAAAIDTLNLYHENDIKTFGGGENAEDAEKPLEIDQKNTKITWLGYNLSTTKAGSGGATEDLPGANIYNEKTAKAQIEAAKEKGDIVIVDLQYFECYCYPEEFVEYPTCDEPIHPGESEWPDQQDFFRHMIDLGADIVVGTQAHQPQAFELYQGKPIYYGLGNLFFDQTYWPDTEKSLILTHYFYNGKVLQTKITPTIYDETYQTAPMDEFSAKAYIERLAQYYKK